MTTRTIDKVKMRVIGDLERSSLAQRRASVIEGTWHTEPTLPRCLTSISKFNEV